MMIIYGVISDKLSEKSKMQNKLDRKWSSVIKKIDTCMYVWGQKFQKDISEMVKNVCWGWETGSG